MDQTMAYEIDTPIPLPIGTELPRNTVLANPIMRLDVEEEPEIHTRTDSGWPTSLSYRYDSHSIGLVFGYPALHIDDIGIEEVDLILTYKEEEWTWQAVVAYSSKERAIERGNYAFKDYEGYELLPWNTDDRLETMEELMEESITPIVHTEGKSAYPVHARQSSDSYEDIYTLFGLWDLSTLENRRKRLFQKVVPREVRWQDKQNDLIDLARDMFDNDGEDKNDP